MSTNQLATVEHNETGITRASLQNTASQLKLLEEFVHDVLKPDQDFGIIPGTDKPSLLKPGAANVINAFQCHSEPHVDFHELDHDTGWENYIVHVDVAHTASGRVVARGFGSCNSYERKYRYREEDRKCPSCGSAAIIKGKEQYGGGWLCWKKKGGCGAKFQDGDQSIEGQSTGQVENADPLDQSNTYLKMAIKRAEVDAALRLPGVARFFTQDLEDIMGAPEQPEKPQEAPEKPVQRQQGQKQAQQGQSQPAPSRGNLGTCQEHKKAWGKAQGGRIGHPVPGGGWCYKDEEDRLKVLDEARFVFTPGGEQVELVTADELDTLVACRFDSRNVRDLDDAEVDQAIAGVQKLLQVHQARHGDETETEIPVHQVNHWAMGEFGRLLPSLTDEEMDTVIEAIQAGQVGQKEEEDQGQMPFEEG